MGCAIDETPQFHASARMSTSYASLTRPQIAWLRRAEFLSRPVSAEKFSAQTFSNAIADIRDLAGSEQDVQRIPIFLAELGVRLVIVEHLSSTKFDGAAFSLDEGSPVIAMAMRFDRIDYMWHTLAHELGHIVTKTVLSTRHFSMRRRPMSSRPTC